MTKKIWFLLLSLFVFFWFWVSFADIVTHGIHDVDRCVKIVNPHGIPWYKLVMGAFFYNGESYIYDIEENKCLPKFWKPRPRVFLYLVDENIDKGTFLSLEDFENNIWKYFKMDWIDTKSVKLDNLNPVLSENLTYKIVEDWNEYRLKLIKKSIGVGSTNLKWGTELSWDEIIITGPALSETVLFSGIIWIGSWFLTILIETIILFLMAKLFRKKDQIPNRRLFLIWVLASTITLPLLRFVVPLFIGYGVKYIIIWELLVTFIEVFILKYWLKISRWKAILASIICNLCSFLIWEVINFFLLPF